MYNSSTVVVHEQILQESRRKVLQKTGEMKSLIDTGNNQIDRVCHLAYHLMKKFRGTAANDWLLNADHEKLARFK